MNLKSLVSIVGCYRWNDLLWGISVKNFVSNCKVRDFYTKVLKEDERQRLCKNIADHLKDAQLFIQKRAVSGLFGF